MHRCMPLLQYKMLSFDLVGHEGPVTGPQMAQGKYYVMVFTMVQLKGACSVL